MFKQHAETTRVIFFLDNLKSRQQFTESDYAFMKDCASELYKSYDVITGQIQPEIYEPLTALVTEISDFYIRAVFDYTHKGKETKEEEKRKE